MKKYLKKKLGRLHDIYRILKIHLRDNKLRSLVSNYRITKKKKLIEYFAFYAKNPEEYWKIAPIKIKNYDNEINDIFIAIKNKTHNQISSALKKIKNK